ncbi:MAG: hypothetical protein KY476_12895 [Planctomycetes bacterium]|nr:hypothetical protein [Planctomycetota bacterium]
MPKSEGRITIDVTETTIGNVLTRTSGYLRTVTSHSLQPYRGCSFGNSLCGAGCYVQHSRHLLGGRPWGSFLEVRTNAADSYRRHYERERRWARAKGSDPFADERLQVWRDNNPQRGLTPFGGRFSIFCSSATDPFVPQETRFGVTRAVLETMLDVPPDELVLQTHSPMVADYVELYRELSCKCDLRVHVSIESDRDRLPGLPPPAAAVARRFEACRILREAGIQTVVTVSPLLPIERPHEFFHRISACAHAVVIDHFIGGDGSADGSRTLRTPMPEAMRRVDPHSTSLGYREAMVEIAQRHLPGRVGVGLDGFARRYLTPTPQDALADASPGQ